MWQETPAPLQLLASGPSSDPLPHPSRLVEAGAEACQILDEAGVPHMVGGGVAVWAYGRQRGTKDIDLFIPCNQPFAALDALGKRGFHTRDTDANWLYKAYRAEILIDLIVWTTGQIRLDAESFRRVRRVVVEGRELPLMGPEDVLFRKILSHREERRDWYDGLSMLAAGVVPIDWEYLLTRVTDPHALRVLSFLLYARADLGSSIVPPAVVGSLMARLPLGA